MLRDAVSSLVVMLVVLGLTDADYEISCAAAALGTIWCCRQHNISEDRAATVHREMFRSVRMCQIALGWALRLG